MKKIYFLIFFCFSIHLYAQTPKAETSEPEEILIEDILSQADEETTFDFNTAFEHLEHYLKRPIDLNKADETLLSDFGLLSPIQIQSLIAYRQTVGKFIAIYELQAVPNFDLITIQSILPYVSIATDIDDLQLTNKEMWLKGNNELFLRYSRQLEQKTGYLPNADGEIPYEGNPDAYYLRFKHQFENRISYGLTAEKDAGEAFFRGANTQGFDYYSAHFYLYNFNKKIKALAIGDFEARLGQGLTMWTGFGTRKSSYALNIKRSGKAIKQYSSVNEANFLRGTGATFNLGKNVEASIFASYRNRDANILNIDTTDINDSEVLDISSLQISGLHRTTSEIENENTIQLFTAGGSLKYQHQKGKIAFNGVYNQLNAPLIVGNQLYNQFDFSGNKLLNLSVDYDYSFRNMHFFGETAYSDNGGFATINGLLVSLDRKVTLAILQRYFDKNYNTLFGQTFSESSGVNNEQGIYVGLEVKPNRYWNFTTYFDQYQFKWLRFGVDAPSKGHELLMQLTHTPFKRMALTFRFRTETKQRNMPDNITKTDYLANTQRIQYRFNFKHKLNKKISLNSRAEWSHFYNGVDWKKGFLMYQEVKYKSFEVPISFATRFAIFDTDNFDTRIYAYETDMLYAFSIPAFFNKGTRFYLKAKYQITRKLTIEARYARTRYLDITSIGSGNEMINGNKRSEFKTQIRWRF